MGDSGDTDSLIAAALAAVGATQSPEQEAALEEVRVSARALGRPCFDAAVSLLDGDPLHRRTGCELLGALCNPDNDGWSPEAAAAIAAVPLDFDDRDLCETVADALHSTYDQIGAPTLISLAHHPDADVRWTATRALPGCAGEDWNDPDVVQVLMHLTRDEDDRIRDWACCGLSQLAVDSSAIRDVFVARLDDDHMDTRYEALLGLARRRDARALPVTMAALAEETVYQLGIEAATYLADPTLLPGLLALRAWWDLDPQLLNSAIVQCDPVAREREVVDLTEFVNTLQAHLDHDTISLSVSVGCGRWDEPTVFVQVTPLGAAVGFERGWDFTALLRRAGSVPGAIAAVLDDIESR